MRSRSAGGRCFPRRPTRTRTISVSRALRLALMLEPLSDHDADCDEGGHRDEPGDETLRDGTEVPDRPAAPVVGVLCVLHVGDDRVELPIADRLLREARHDV